MFSLNRAMVIGNLTRDPELRYTPKGQSVASFAVATNRRWTTAEGQQQDETQFHEIVAWGKLAEIAQQLLFKGKKVYVEGRLQTRTWEGQDGAKRNRTEIVAENIIALSPRSTGNEEVETSFPAVDNVKGAPDTKPDNTKKTNTKSSPAAPANDDSEIKLEDIPF